MTLTNPFGIERYLHPRRAGMIVFKGGGGAPAPAPMAPVVNVDGGLSDAQYQNLIGGIGSPTVAGVDGADPTAATGLYNEAATIGTNMDTGFAGVNTGIEGVQTDVTGIGTNLSTGFTNIQDLLDQNTTNMNTAFTGINTNMADNAAAINTGLGTLQTSQDTGFADVGTRFDTVDQSNVNMQTAVDQGFQDQAQGFTDVNANMSAGFADNATAVNTGFADAAAAMNQGFGDASTQLTNTQANVLEGQQGLGTTLDNMGATADAYATQSLTNQADLQSGQDQFVSTFDDYVERYSDDTQLAQNTRADMQTANANANQAIRSDMAAQSNTAQTQATEAARNLQAIRLNQARTAALQAASNPGIDQNMRQNFANLATAFDSNGNVIRTSVDSNGNRIMRSLDSAGNLNLTSYNSLGQPIGNQSLNVAQSLNLLDQLAPASASSGIASPYATTAS